MKLLVDADACPVVGIVEELAQKYALPCVLLCDTSHVLHSAYSEIRVIGAGADAVDIALANLCEKGDVAVTQDYGVAALVLGKGAYCLHQSGRRYTKDNIDLLLYERYEAKKARMASGKNHLKGPRRRTREDDRRFYGSLDALLKELTGAGQTE